MRSRLGFAALLAASLVIVPAAQASAAEVSRVTYCSLPRTVSLFSDQTGWGSHTYDVTDQVFNIVQPFLFRKTTRTYGAAVSTGWTVHSVNTIHSASASCLQ